MLWTLFKEIGSEEKVFLTGVLLHSGLSYSDSTFHLCMEYKRRLNKDSRWIWKYLVSSPFIYAVFFPVVLLDIVLEVYHRVSFPLYGLPYVKRGTYIRFDHAKLSYLSWEQRFNCVYCSYVNGFLHYASAIAGETEKYWCGIQHIQDPAFHHSPHHKDLLPYGDESAYKAFVGEPGPVCATPKKSKAKGNTTPHRKIPTRA